MAWIQQGHQFFNPDTGQYYVPQINQQDGPGVWGTGDGYKSVSGANLFGTPTAAAPEGFDFWAAQGRQSPGATFGQGLDPSAVGAPTGQGWLSSTPFGGKEFDNTDNSSLMGELSNGLKFLAMTYGLGTGLSALTGASAGGAAAAGGAMDMGVGGVGEAMGLGAGAGAGSGSLSLADLPWGVNQTGGGMPYGDPIEGLIDLTNQGFTGEQAIAKLGEINPAWTQTGIEFMLNNPGSIASAAGGAISLSDLMRVAGPVASLGGAAIGASAAKGAAQTQANAAQQAGQLANQQYQQTRSDLMPWQTSGLQGNTALQQYLGLGQGAGGGWDQNAPGVKGFTLADFQESPAYQFNLQEGQRAIDNASRARGTYYAPATLKQLGQYSQGQASNEFQNALGNYRNMQQDIYGRLSGVSQSGQNAATQTGQFGQNAANTMGNAVTGAGNAQAAGQVGASNAITGGLSGAYNAYLLSQILEQNQRSIYGQ